MIELMALTPAEEQLMKHLWKLNKAFFKELRAEYAEPRPATTTINTLLKRLIDKDFVAFKLYGNSRQYYPLVSKEQYFSVHMQGLIQNFFNNSVQQFASFFTKEVKMSDEELRQLREMVDEQLDTNAND